METGYRPRDYTVEEEFAVLDENAIDAEFTVVDDAAEVGDPCRPVHDQSSHNETANEYYPV